MRRYNTETSGKTNPVIFWCLALVLFGVTNIYGQEVRPEEAALNEALGQHRNAFADLVRARGVTTLNVSDPDAIVGARPINHAGRITRQDISTALSGYPPETAVLFYSYRAESLRVWLIDGTGIQAYDEENISGATLSKAISDLRASLGVDAISVNRVLLPIAVQDPPAPKAVPRLPFGPAVRNLTRILLPQPIATRLNTVRHLIVAPILDIGIVPFAILQPFGDDRFLVDKMSISIAPSVYDVVSDIERWQPDFRNALVVGNPYFPPDQKWKVRNLPGAESEARYVAGVVNAKPLIGKFATKEEVVERAKAADFLYFATHGIANTENPLDGGFLMLSASTTEKGWWTAGEIQTSRLGAQLAVLSACQTGLGKVHNAGIIGLSRAFQIAGVPRVAMSLWSVSDKATADLLRAFVGYLRQNVPSEALRLAMLDARKHESNPAKWASFVLFGTPR